MNNYLKNIEYKKNQRYLTDVGYTSSQDEREVYLNKIDAEVTSLLLSAEKVCRKLRTGTVSYSLELSKLGLKWRFWRKVVYFKQGRFFDEIYLERTIQRLLHYC